MVCILFAVSAGSVYSETGASLGGRDLYIVRYPRMPPLYAPPRNLRNGVFSCAAFPDLFSYPVYSIDRMFWNVSSYTVPYFSVILIHTYDCSLYGTSVLQSYYYMLHCDKDPMWTKSFVALLL